MIKPSKRIENLPPYLFAQIDAAIQKKRDEGADVISLGIGDPDLPTFQRIVDVAVKEVRDPRNHRYPSYRGLLEFRKSIADWYRRRFGVDLDPENEVLALIGSKEGIAHVSMAFLDREDLSLVPDPGYPVYQIGAILAGSNSYQMPLLQENSYLPDLESIPPEVTREAKLMFINYPNNPTAAVADINFFKQVVDFARENQILVCHDNAYSEITFDGYVAPSILQVKSAKDVAIEFHSLSKTYNMTGWRVGFVVGNNRAIDILGSMKTNIDSGIFEAIQRSGIEALRSEEGIDEMRSIYQRRRDLACDALTRMGLEVEKPKGTIYLWVKVPAGYSSASFTEKILDEAAVVVAPGNGYGRYGEGYFRISLSISDGKMMEALNRMDRTLAGR